jgi:hypothetical protein
VQGSQLPLAAPDPTFPFPGLSMTPGFLVSYTGLQSAAQLGDHSYQTGAAGSPQAREGNPTQAGTSSAFQSRVPDAAPSFPLPAGSSDGWVDATAGYDSAVVVPDISFEAGTLMTGLGLTGDSYTGVVGEARALLKVPPWAGTGVVFQVGNTCHTGGMMLDRRCCVLSYGSAASMGELGSNLSHHLLHWHP